MSKNWPGPISAGQCRAGRGILGISQQWLADEAGVSRSTVIDFESGKRRPHARHLAALRATLEAAGVIFIDANGGGPGVRLA